MTRRRPGTAAFAALTGALLLLGATACTGGGGDDGSGGDDALPIEVVSQPDHEGEPISLDLPVHSSGAFEFDQWPSACDLVDQETIQAVLPGATEVAQEAEPMELTLLGIGTDPEDTHTVPEARCSMSAGFDADGLRLEDGNVVMNVIVEVHQAGDAEFVERNRQQPGGEQVEIGDATCAAQDQMAYTCAMENISFSVMIDARPYAQYTDADASVYSVDGEEVDYSEDTDAFLTMSQEKILRPMVEIAVQRLSA